MTTPNCGCRRDVKPLLRALMTGEDVPDCPTHPTPQFDAGQGTPLALNDDAGLAAAIGGALNKKNRHFETDGTSPSAA